MSNSGQPRSSRSTLASHPHADVSPAEIVRAEAAALLELARHLETTLRRPFESAVALLEQAIDGRQGILLTGVGKSGLIAQKIAATLRSTGTPAHFLHPTEALHGDLGMLAAGDVLLALSASGETEEILNLLPIAQRLRLHIIALCCANASSLARAAEITLDLCISEEACPHNLAPTTSTTVMLAIGDALALAVSQSRGFAPEDFADLHPGGRLGRRLARVGDLMHTGDDIPRISATTLMPDVIYEMSRKKLGLTSVCEDRRLLGMISDGDLRRILEREGAHALARTAGEVMNATPLTIAAGALATAALAAMEARSVTALLVTTPSGDLEGVLHLHDLWALGTL